MLPLIDYELVRRNPKPLFGFSDNTALQLGLYARAKAVTCTGFTLKYDFKNGHIDGFVDETLRTVISGGKLNLRGGQTVIGGQTEGILLGGCLSCFAIFAVRRFIPISPTRFC